MEHPARDSLYRPRLVMALACAAALFTLGFALSARPQQASAGGLLPTVTLPGITTLTLPTVTTPTVPGSTTTVVTTTVNGTPPSPGQTAAVTTTAATTTPSLRSTAHVSGAKRLRSGAISIPVSSVRAPAHLRLVVHFVPSTRTPSVRVQVIDTRGYLVRRARVSMAIAPARALLTAKPKLSADDGWVAFPVNVRETAGLRSTVTLTIRAVDPTAPGLANASSRLRLTIRPHS